jgi:hypothetical protein
MGASVIYPISISDNSHSQSIYLCGNNVGAPQRCTIVRKIAQKTFLGQKTCQNAGIEIASLGLVGEQGGARKKKPA